MSQIFIYALNIDLICDESVVRDSETIEIRSQTEIGYPVGSTPSNEIESAAVRTISIKSTIRD